MFWWVNNLILSSQIFKFSLQNILEVFLILAPIDISECLCNLNLSNSFEQLVVSQSFSQNNVDGVLEIFNIEKISRKKSYKFGVIFDLTGPIKLLLRKDN